MNRSTECEEIGRFLKRFLNDEAFDWEWDEFESEDSPSEIHKAVLEIVQRVCILDSGAENQFCGDLGAGIINSLADCLLYSQETETETRSGNNAF